jgi:hypothetical protein
LGFAKAKEIWLKEWKMTLLTILVKKCMVGGEVIFEGPDCHLSVICWNCDQSILIESIFIVGFLYLEVED